MPSRAWSSDWVNESLDNETDVHTSNGSESRIDGMTDCCESDCSLWRVNVQGSDSVLCWYSDDKIFAANWKIRNR